MTQTLTQTTQKMDGNNGVDPSKEHLLPEQTGPESGENRRLETVRAPTDQKAGSSNLSGRTKTREKPCVSCGFCLVFEGASTILSFCSFIICPDLIFHLSRH